jgi:hypothetical protein
VHLFCHVHLDPSASITLEDAGAALDRTTMGISFPIEITTSLFRYCSPDKIPLVVEIEKDRRGIESGFGNSYVYRMFVDRH